jgi:hypothetical protein
MKVAGGKPMLCSTKVNADGISCGVIHKRRKGCARFAIRRLKRQTTEDEADIGGAVEGLE